MKDYFDKNRHELTEQEKHDVWREISRPLKMKTRRTWWQMPALTTSVVAAVAAVVVIVTQDPADHAALEPENPAGYPGHQEELAVAPTGPMHETVVSSPARSRSEQAASEDAVGTVVARAAEKSSSPVEAAREEAPFVAEAAEDPGLQVMPHPMEEKVVLVEDIPPVPATLDLRVFDSDTGEELRYASVMISTELDSLIALMAADFFPQRIPAGEHTVRVSHLGYAPRETTLTVEPGKRLELAMAADPVIVETLGSFDVPAAKYMVQANDATAGPTVGRQTFRRYAIDSAEGARSRQAGAVVRDGRTYDRGGRSDEVEFKIAGRSIDAEKNDGDRPIVMPVEPTPGELPPGWWNPPNGKPYDLVFHEHYGTNPFIVTEEDALSTFAVDVDNASWTIARRYLTDGHLPDKDAVRVEEFINFFDQGYPAVESGDFAIRADGMPSPYGDGYHLLRVGLQARDVAAGERKPANLIFVIDVSGSMNRENRLGLVKQALHILVGQLRESDTVGLVIYGSTGQVVLEPTSIEDRGHLLRAIDSLAPGGSTNAEQGLNLAYDMARRHYWAGAINRLILCADGVANTGRTGADDILEIARRQSDRGISLSTIGFGMGNYNDVLMEQLADNGDGNYYYIDSLKEADRVFRENLTGTLQTIARDTKIQVEFNPEHVLRYRLIGYENRDVADEDFRNDAVDAGEVGAGHEVTALYEMKLTEEAAFAISKGSNGFPLLATARLRYEIPANAPGGGTVVEMAEEIRTDNLVDTVSRGSLRLQQAALVAEFGEILRGSYWAKGSRIAQLVPTAGHLARALSRDEDVIELEAMIGRAAGLENRDD